MKCDFCGDEESREWWRYPCATFHLTAGDFRGEKRMEWDSREDWIACLTCTWMIENDAWSSLAFRAVDHHPDMPLHFMETVLQSVELLHQAFNRNRLGERKREV